MARIEASVEGPITTAPALAGGTVNFRAAGVVVRFTPGKTNASEEVGGVSRRKTIRTPTQELTPAQFVSTAKFEGRSENGFLNATVIAEGFYDNVAGFLDASFLSVEPAENVLLGAITTNNPGTPRNLAVNGVPIRMLTDPRLSSNPASPSTIIYRNQYGFPFKVELIGTSPTGDPPPPPTSVEGYFAGGVFHAFLFEAGVTGQLIDPPATIPQINIERVQYRDQGATFRLETRGHVTSFHNQLPGGADVIQQLALFRLDRDVANNLVETPLGATFRIDQREPGYQRWRVSESFNKFAFPANGVPELIRVVNLSSLVPASGTNAAHPAFDELPPDRVR